MLDGRRVLLAVTGGVAAYKSAYLARRLVEANAQVKVILTDSALEFIGPQTFAAITGEQPYTSLFSDERSVSPHTELARWAQRRVAGQVDVAFQRRERQRAVARPRDGRRHDRLIDGQAHAVEPRD